MSFFDSIMNKLSPQNDEDEGYLDDEYIDDYEDEESQATHHESRFSSIFGGNRNAEVIQGGAAQTVQLVTVKPKEGMEDCKYICDSLLDGTTVIMNLEGLTTENAQRIIDFTLGAIYAINGDLKSINRYIFVASPKNVELSGDFMKDFAGRAINPAFERDTASTTYTSSTASTSYNPSTGGFHFNA